MTERFTIAELAAHLNVDREIVRGLIRFLIAVDLADQKGERRLEGGRGKAEHVYSFRENFDGRLVEILKDGRK